MLRRSSIERTGKRKCLFVGKKTLEWMRIRARLKKKFAEAGITSCELGYPGCWRDEALGFAHGRKRRHLQGDEIETLTILSCTPCHDVIERMSAPAMLCIVQSVIAERGWTVATANVSASVSARNLAR